MQHNTKQYGLIKMSKGASSGGAPLMKKPSIFDESDGSHSDSESVPQFQTSSTARKQAKVKISQAIEEDPSIFQYDEVYDAMKSNDTKLAATTKAPLEKKPRYIENMIKNKDKREKEQELRAERKIQKERELEGDEFADKEAFVTSAYKEKLEQMRKAQEEIDRQENIDNILDVTKQNDLNGFYRSLYRNNLFNPDQAPDSANSIETKEEVQSVKFNKKSANQKKINIRERNLVTEGDEDGDSENEESVVIRSASKAGPEEKSTGANLPADSPATSTADKSKEHVPQVEPKLGPSEEKAEADEKVDAPKAEEAPPPEEVVVKKPKIDRAELIRQMFTKRTVGQVFEDARQRYLERKALRQIA